MRGEERQTQHSVPDHRSTVEITSGLYIIRSFFLYNVENSGSILLIFLCLWFGKSQKKLFCIWKVFLAFTKQCESQQTGFCSVLFYKLLVTSNAKVQVLLLIFFSCSVTLTLQLLRYSNLILPLRWSLGCNSTRISSGKAETRVGCKQFLSSSLSDNCSVNCFTKSQIVVFKN